ncbi:dienelactone hydrolase family protein [Longibacter sp.]|uniref:dienelactone hydrolase family protein n=1 Tax=Longibacter sp. TaxID=2045415 RepID=UPI003EC02ED3
MIFAVLFIGLFAGCRADDTSDSYTEDMAEEHAADTPEATEAAREPLIPIDTSTVAYATSDAGKEITGYMAVPENPDSILAARGIEAETERLPGVVLIHEWWGLNENIRTAARRVSGEGYRVLAVDLYGGSVADTPDGARGLMQQAMEAPDRLADNLASANAYLQQEAGAPRTVVMGWCFGGAMTLTAAINQPEDYAGAVVYYGRVSDITAEALAPISFPVIGFFGADDGSIPVSSVRDFENTMQEVGNEIDVYIYENAGHAFANPSGRNYQPEAAADAWNRTTAFLQKQLYGTEEVGATGSGDS